ncbi:MAG: VCBS repeat-containing protein [Euryarchaeota archaeon]|nr:VCBS repeat-containing protein [Euryarchaeota archaeon]
MLAFDRRSRCMKLCNQNDGINMTTHQVAKNGVVATDIDGDGWPDLYAANDYDANALYLNRRAGTFREVASCLIMIVMAMRRRATGS